MVGISPYSAHLACFDQNSEQNNLCDWFDVCKLIVAEKGDSVARKTGAQSFRSKVKTCDRRADLDIGFSFFHRPDGGGIMTIITTNFAAPHSLGNHNGNNQYSGSHDKRDVVPTSPKMKQILADYWVSNSDRRKAKQIASVLELKNEMMPEEPNRQFMVAGSK